MLLTMLIAVSMLPFFVAQKLKIQLISEFMCSHLPKHFHTDPIIKCHVYNLIDFNKSIEQL